MPRRYRAFISYSHADERWARWLQGALERYRVPRRLRQREGAEPLPARLYPVFRDREELASANDLSAQIQQAMADSDALIVICSPAAAASRWVNEEIRRFQADGRGDRVFCLLVAGSPHASANDCAFPPALLHTADGTPGHEPLAADVLGDGKRNALLKLAAGLLGVGVDDLRQRDAQRRARLWSAVAAASLAIAAFTIGMAVLALLARQESERRREGGERLIGFMLGDLRGKLEPLGKLDLLDAVGDQAMDYFAAIGARGSPSERLARAKALRQIGEVRFNQGKLEPALAAFTQSLNQARALHERAPADNDYLFELGQAEFWVGYVAWQRNDLDFASVSFERYMQRSRELLGRAPGNPDYRLELSYAYGNLGSVARERGQAGAALGHFQQSEAALRQLLAADPNNVGRRFDLSETLSWIGSTLLDLGRLRDSAQAFQQTYDLLATLHAGGQNRRYSHKFADIGILLAWVALHLGQQAEAATLLDRSIAVSQALVAHDPANAGWRRVLFNGQRYRAELALAGGDAAMAERLLTSAAAGLTQLTRDDPSNREYAFALAMAERVQALGLLAAGAKEEALIRGGRALARMQSALGSGGRGTSRLDAALVAETLGRIQQAAGQPEPARASWLQAQAWLDAGRETGVVADALRAELAWHLGQPDAARTLSKSLRAAGFADPRFALPPTEP